MKTLEEIKNEVAQQYSFSNYKEFCQLTRNVDTDIVFIMDGFINKFATILQQEQQKLIAGNVFNANNYTVEDGIQLITDNKIKSSIINENNIIK